tara:strand:- start:501 stop:1028 length:528 start_codon:yes stop_codon:yes gene_type:complete
MAQEFTIKSQDIEDKINQLLPSQGGFQAGVDFSASTMVIPIVDLTETAEGSSLRQDLQTAVSHNSATTFNVSNTTSTVLNTTGYYRLVGTIRLRTGSGSAEAVEFIISDGTTDKTINGLTVTATSVTSAIVSESYDFVFKLEAGDSFIVKSSYSAGNAIGSVRQIADVNGNLINP